MRPFRLCLACFMMDSASEGCHVDRFAHGRRGIGQILGQTFSHGLGQILVDDPQVTQNTLDHVAKADLGQFET